MDEAEVEQFLDNMSQKRGQPLKRPRQGLEDGEVEGEEREEEADEQSAKRQHINPVLSGLTARLQEIFPQVICWRSFGSNARLFSLVVEKSWQFLARQLCCGFP